ncbi:MAG: hypothetical protein I8H77_09340 [Comamonadaceae bacterium]|nr:hypothetical protein [Comamonadaceae bacterium]
MAFSSMPTTAQGWKTLENEHRERRPAEEAAAIEDAIAYGISLLSEGTEIVQRFAVLQSQCDALSDEAMQAEGKLQLAAQLTSDAEVVLATLETNLQENWVSQVALQQDFYVLTQGDTRSAKSGACTRVILSAISEARSFEVALQQAAASCRSCINFCATVLAEA